MLSEDGGECWIVDPGEDAADIIAFMDGHSLRPYQAFTPMMRHMAAVGEVGGSLPETFGETARLHEMMLSVAVKRFGMLIEPVMIVVTAVIVGFVYIAFFTAIFAMAGAS